MEPYEDILDEAGGVRPERVDDLLIEVISGKVIFESGDRLYACRPPTTAEQDRGRILYVRRMRDCRRRGVASKAEILRQAMDAGVFSGVEMQEKANLAAMIERYAKSRQQSTDPSQKTFLDADAEIRRMEGRLLELEASHAEIYSHSAEAVAEEARLGFYIACCTLTGDLLDRPVWPGWEEYRECKDGLLVEDSRDAFVRIASGLPSKVIRALSRTHEWRARWRGARESNAPLFDGPSGCWDRNKLNIVYWSEFYDTILSHPEAPREEIIRDDDALQEWLNSQLLKRQQEAGRVGQRGKGPVPTYRDGRGNRRQMTRIGSTTIAVGAPYRIRTPQAPKG